MLCVTSTLAIVAVQQLQLDVMDQRIKAMDSRFATIAEKVDAKLASILSRITNDIEDPINYQTTLVEYTLQGIQESYTMTGNLRDAIIMLVTLLQSQIATTRAVQTKKWPSLIITQPGAWFNTTTRIH
jgi:hypothetical protein